MTRIGSDPVQYGSHPTNDGTACCDSRFIFRVFDGVRWILESQMADNNGGGNSFLGVVVGALLVVVLGLGAFMYLGHNQQPSGPSLHVTVPSPPSTPGK